MGDRGYGAAGWASGVRPEVNWLGLYTLAGREVARS